MRAINQNQPSKGELQIQNQNEGAYLVSSVDRPLPLPLLDMTSAHVRIHLLDDRVYLQTV